MNEKVKIKKIAVVIGIVFLGNFLSSIPTFSLSDPGGSGVTSLVFAKEPRSIQVSYRPNPEYLPRINNTNIEKSPCYMGNVAFIKEGVFVQSLNADFLNQPASCFSFVPAVSLEKTELKIAELKDLNFKIIVVNNPAVLNAWAPAPVPSPLPLQGLPQPFELFVVLGLFYAMHRALRLKISKTSLIFNNQPTVFQLRVLRC